MSTSVISVTEVQTVVVPGDSTAVIETTGSDVIIAEGTSGPQGVPGIPGQPGPAGQNGTNGLDDKTFTQDFSSASVVAVTHNLGKRPSVTVIDSAGDECEGNVVHINNNSLTVTFSAPFSGTVICN